MNGDENRTDGERIAALSEQMKGMRHDFNEFKQEMKTTLQTFISTVSTMHKDYMPRTETEREIGELKRENDELRKKIEAAPGKEEFTELKGKVEKLHGRPTITTAGVFAAATTVIGLLISYIAMHGGK